MILKTVIFFIFLLATNICNYQIFAGIPNSKFIIPSEESQQTTVAVSSALPSQLPQNPPITSDTDLPVFRFRSFENFSNFLKSGAGNVDFVSTTPPQLIALMGTENPANAIWKNRKTKESMIWICSDLGLVVKEFYRQNNGNCKDDSVSLNAIRRILPPDHSELPNCFVRALASIEFQKSNSILYRKALGQSLGCVIIHRPLNARDHNINRFMQQFGENLFAVHQYFAQKSQIYTRNFIMYADSRCTRFDLKIPIESFSASDSSTPLLFREHATTICMGDLHSNNIFWCREEGITGQKCRISIIDYAESMARDIKNGGSSIANDVSYFMFCMLYHHKMYFYNNGVNRDNLMGYMENFLTGYLRRLTPEERKFFGAHIAIGYAYLLERLAFTDLKKWDSFMYELEKLHSVYSSALRMLA